MRRFIWRVPNKRTYAPHTATSCHGNKNKYASSGYMLFYCKSYRRTQVVLYSCMVSMSYHKRVQSYKESLHTSGISLVDGDVPRSTCYGVNISQLIQFARESSHADDFNTRNKFTAKLLER